MHTTFCGSTSSTHPYDNLLTQRGFFLILQKSESKRQLVLIRKHMNPCYCPKEDMLLGFLPKIINNIYMQSLFPDIRKETFLFLIIHKHQNTTTSDTLFLNLTLFYGTDRLPN